jgi:hypothetical protein
MSMTQVSFFITRFIIFGVSPIRKQTQGFSFQFCDVAEVMNIQKMILPDLATD